MDDDSAGQQEWYILESMKATERVSNPQTSLQTREPGSSSKENQNDWFTLQEVDHQKTSSNISDHTKLVEKDINQSLSNVEKESIDFQISKAAFSTSIPEQNRVQRLSLDHDMASSPVSLRLNLQASIDGEISTNSESSTQGTHTDNVHQSIFSSINIDNDKSSKHEWINLTSVSSMQDVDRPEPLGRTEQILDAPTQQQQIHSNTSITSISNQSGGLKSSSSSKKTISKASSKSTTTVDSDLPDLSYTRSLEDPYLNKRVGPAQDVKLQSLSSETMSSMSASSSDMNTNFTASRYSNETPVTKLLGPAYKQTERFLKDLQEAKLSFSNDTKISGFEEGDFSRSSTSSRDESIQVGKSKLSMSFRSSNSSQRLHKERRQSSTKRRSENLTEQDIVSASIVDGDLDSTSSISNDNNKISGSNDEQSSEGELAINELSTSANTLGERKSRSRSTTSNQPSSSLEPITEILSPEKSNNVSSAIPKDDSFVTGNISPFPKGDISPFPKGNSIVVNSIHNPISSTSTPNDNVTKNPSSHGIYDVRDSTGPGSTNRKRMSKGETPLSRRSKETIDPFQVYVSEESKLAATTGSSQDTLKSRGLQRLTSQEIDVTTSVSKFIQSPGINSTTSITKNVDDPLGRNLSKERLSLSLKGTTSDSSSTEFEQQLLEVEHNLSAMRALSIKTKSSIISNNNNNNNNNHFEYSSSKESETTPRSLPRRSYVFPNQIASDLSSHVAAEKMESSDTDQSKHEQMKENYRNASLNELWQTFEKSFRGDDNSDSKNSKSPLLKKLQVVSSLLKESRERSNQRRHLVSETSATSEISYCETHTPYPVSDNVTSNLSVTTPRHSVIDDNNTPITKPEFVCPVCQRREVGTNFPTPPYVASDSHNQRQQQREVESPLTLQTWTQTSPYIIDSNLFFSTKYPSPTARDLKEKKIHRHHKSPGRHHQKYNNKTERNRLFSRSGHSRTQKSSSKDVQPCTAWFQSVRSDVSDIVPLCNIPALGSLYSNVQEKREESKKIRDIPNANLQEAFLRYKKTFIKRSENRIQQFKDTFQRDKHGEVFNKQSEQCYQEGNIAVEKRHSIQARPPVSHRAEKERIYIKEKYPRAKSRVSSARRSPVETPRNYQQMEEKRIESLRQNRLKMKLYDLKIRERFLKRRAKTRINKEPKYIVVRH